MLLINRPCLKINIETEMNKKEDLFGFFFLNGENCTDEEGLDAL